MRERWFGGTGRRVPEICVEGELDLADALVLDDVSAEEALRDAHARTDVARTASVRRLSMADDAIDPA